MGFANSRASSTRVWLNPSYAATSGPLPREPAPEWERTQRDDPMLRDRLRTIDRRAAQIHRRDLACVLDVVERVGVEHDKVGALAGFERSGVRYMQEFR